MNKVQQKKSNRPPSAKDLLLSRDWLERREKSAKYITTEHQQYGISLATRLNDWDHRALYIKLAKEEERPILEKAYSFTADYHQAKNKGKIFMWKLTELRKEREEKEKKEKKKQMNLI